MKKKLLAIIAVMAMVVAMVPSMVFAADGILTGTGETDNPILIEDAKDLKALRDGLNNGTISNTSLVKVTSDIDLGGETWTPINSFAGEFDGNDKTIKNFRIDATAANGGFFGTIGSGAGERVHDLTLSGVKATVGAYRFGTLANSVQGIVNRVTVKDVEVTTTNTAAWVGGMCAFMSWPWMNDCKVENLAVNAENGADLIAGFSPILQKNSNMVFDNLDVKGFKVTVEDTDSSGCGVAGFVTQTQRGWEYPKVTNCDITGIDITAEGNVDVGGFIAWPGAHTTAENCTTEGKIDASGVTEDNFAGGFFGNLGWNADLGQKGHKVIGCTADVDIITKVAPAGGFVGSATNSNNSSMYAEFTNCVAKGDVTCVAGGTAPVGGFAGDADRGVYDNCKATGKVSGQAEAGGFIGKIKDTTMKYDGRYPAGTRDYLADDIAVEACTGSNDVTGATDKTGGMIGHIVDGSKLTLNSSKYPTELPEYNPNELKNPIINITVDYSEADKTTGEVIATITANIGEAVGTISDESWAPTDKDNQWKKVFKDNAKEIVVLVADNNSKKVEYEVTVDVTNAGLPPVEEDPEQNTEKQPDTDNSNKVEEDNEKAIDTGDDMNMAIPFAIAGLALAAMAAVVATRRRES